MFIGHDRFPPCTTLNEVAHPARIELGDRTFITLPEPVIGLVHFERKTVHRVTEHLVLTIPRHAIELATGKT